MDKDIEQILLSEEQIQNRIRELGEILTAEYADKNPVIVGVLKGVVVFYADMIRQIKVPCQMDFMWISSYAGTNSTGKMEVKRDISADIKGRHVLILEDIYDTGSSLYFTYRHLLSKEPASLKICTFLDKPERRKPGITLNKTVPSMTVAKEILDEMIEANKGYQPSQSSPSLCSRL